MILLSFENNTPSSDEKRGFASSTVIAVKFGRFENNKPPARSIKRWLYFAGFL
jgi:hypothetical protein